MKFEIIKAADLIYWLKFDNQYDMAMTFLRYQEFYESPNEQFRGKSFSLLDFMEWYAKDHYGVFTYPEDWSGFNLPGSVIKQVIQNIIPDHNKYDEEMFKVYQQIKEMAWKESYSDDFYLIGSYDDDLDPHEFGHACFYIDKSYRREMEKNIKLLDGKIYQKLYNHLLSIGYDQKVMHDEMQAYLSTSYHSGIIQNCKKKDWERIIKPFRETFFAFNKEVPLLKEYFINETI